MKTGNISDINIWSQINKLLLVIFIVILNGCLVGSGGEYKDTGFTISILFKREADTTFIREKSLTYEIIKTSGNGFCERPYNFEIKIKNSNNQAWTGIIKVDLETNFKEARFFFPGYLYGNNQASSKLQPGLTKEFQRIRRGAVSKPFSPFWFMRSDQLTHPVALAYSDKKFIGIAGSPYLTNNNPFIFWKPGIVGFNQYNGFHCSVDGKVAVGYTVGYQNYPGIYTTPWIYEKYSKQKQGCIIIQPDQTITIPIKVYSFGPVPETDLGKILENIYNDYHEPPLYQKNQSVLNTASVISQAISKDAYFPAGHAYSLIRLAPLSKKESNTFILKRCFSNSDYLYNNEGLIAWTNGMVIAVPLLQASYRLNKSELREQAIEVANYIMKNSLNPRNGLPYCTKIDNTWTNKGWWTDNIKSENRNPEHSSYIIGQSLYYFLKAYELEKINTGIIHKEWLDFAGNVLQKVISSQDSAGAFPRFWSENNLTGTEYDAFSGCWIAAALAYYIKITGKEELITAVRKSENYYYQSVSGMECFKTPLDVADSPDSEGVLAYIRLTKILYQLTGEPVYLDRMRSGIDYALSFTFCYNVPITAPPLNKMSWSTCGGSITSVCNAVIHCMLNSITDEIFFYCKMTGDFYYWNRMLDILFWGMQVYNKEDQQFLFGKKGWSTEFFCQSERYVLEIYLQDSTRSNIWFAYHPWATASVLEGICGYTWNEKPEYR